MDILKAVAKSRKKVAIKEKEEDWTCHSSSRRKSLSKNGAGTMESG